MRESPPTNPDPQQDELTLGPTCHFGTRLVPQQARQIVELRY
jgi:hypothetical protein